MKRKLTGSLAVALALALVLAGAALAVGITVFERFSRDDARLVPFVQDAALREETPLSIESEALGTSAIRFDSAYYDGQSLLVGIVMENTTRSEPFTPTAEEVSAMEPVEPDSLSVPLSESEDDSDFEAFREAVARGEPRGLVQYAVYPSDQIIAGDGTRVSPAISSEALSEDGSLLELREMETPLPEAIQDLDGLELRLSIWQSVNRYWFDGETLYESFERSPAGEAVCAVKRSDAERVLYAGEGEYNGVAVSLELSLSALHGDLTVTAAGDAFPPLSDRDAFYDVILTDERGEALRELKNSADADRIHASYNGLGRLPETVTARVVVEAEGDWDEDAALRAAQPIELTRTE